MARAKSSPDPLPGAPELLTPGEVAAILRVEPGLRRTLAALSDSLPPGWRAWHAHGWLYAVGANLLDSRGALMTLASRSAADLAVSVAAEVARQERAMTSPFERSAA